MTDEEQDTYLYSALRKSTSTLAQARAATFYIGFGFTEIFRTPAVGETVHIELKLDGFTLGIATVDAAREDHGLQPQGEGRWIVIVLWIDCVDEAVSTLVSQGASLVSPVHDFLKGKLRVAWVADPDGNLIQLVQHKK